MGTAELRAPSQPVSSGKSALGRLISQDRIAGSVGCRVDGKVHLGRTTLIRMRAQSVTDHALKGPPAFGPSWLLAARRGTSLLSAVARS